jgi:polysaccharide export outer membrane protein
MKRYLFITTLAFLLTACASREKMVYLVDIDNKQTDVTQNYEPKLQPDDVLSIIVNSNAPELVAKFNPGLVSFQNTSERGSGVQRLQSYLIDGQGEIVFPVIGSIKLGGLTTTEATTKLTEALKPHVVDATINLRLMNFKVTVQGEVARPGTFTVESERITLFQALSLAGDIALYGKRDNILIIREIDGKRTYNRVDVTKPDFMESEFYYLAPNDVVYVEPNKIRVNSSAVGPNLTFALSALSLLTTIVVIIISRS